MDLKSLGNVKVLGAQLWNKAIVSSWDGTWGIRGRKRPYAEPEAEKVDPSLSTTICPSSQTPFMYFSTGKT